MKGRYTIAIGISTISILLLGAQADACSRVFPTYIVKSDFVVSVTDRGKPLRGIEVQISREVRKPRFHFETAQLSLTNDEGEAPIHGLSPGSYFIVVTHAGIEGGDGGELEVAPDSPSIQGKLSLHWPAHPIIEVQNVAGVLAAGKEQIPLAGTIALLLEALTGRQVGATVANERGHVEFRGWVEPGLYILRVSQQGVEKKGMTLIHGDIFVEVDANAKSKELPRFGLMMSSCGLTAYKEDDSIVIF